MLPRRSPICVVGKLRITHLGLLLIAMLLELLSKGGLRTYHLFQAS